MHQVPVLFIHGWKSHPGIWNTITRALEGSSIPIWRFDHSSLTDIAFHDLINRLEKFLFRKREETGYHGEIDIVTHSMGGFLCRYLLEVKDIPRRHQVRQLIMIGPPNNGATMAELFNHETIGPHIISSLSGVFVPREYNPAEDPIVQGIRFTSKETRELKQAGKRDDIRYRTIVALNRSGEEGIFPLFQGKTWVCSPDGTWMQTWFGDGIIPYADTRLPGTMWDLIGAEPDPAIDPYQYCHILLPKNPEVVRLVTGYLINPEKPSAHTWPDDTIDP